MEEQGCQVNEYILSEYQKQLIEKEKENFDKFVKNLPPQFNKIIKKDDVDEFKSAQKQVENYSKMVQSFYSKTIEHISKELPSTQDSAIPSHLEEYIKSALKNTLRIQTEHEQTPPIIKESLVAMMNLGWYPDIDNFACNILINFRKEVLESSIEEINNAFVEYYESELAAIKDQLFTKYPKRKEIFQAAFEAHEDGKYLLSIPVFLTQIDGIAIDSLEQHFFMKSDKNPRTALAIKGIRGLGEFSLALLIPLQLDQPIMQKPEDRGKDFTGLNRHQVLHGEVVDYGIKINSYKAISLLLYISQASEIISDNNGAH